MKYDFTFPMNKNQEDCELLYHLTDWTITSFGRHYRSQSDYKTVGLDWIFKDNSVSWGLEKSDDSRVTILHKPVRYLKISEHCSDNNGPYRSISFLDVQGYKINDFWLPTSFWPETYPSTTLQIPIGFFLIGFAIASNKDCSINYISFTIWQPPFAKK